MIQATLFPENRTQGHFVKTAVRTAVAGQGCLSPDAYAGFAFGEDTGEVIESGRIGRWLWIADFADGNSFGSAETDSTCTPESGLFNTAEMVVI